MRRYRFQILLLALMAQIVTMPLVPALGDAGTYVASLVFALMLLASVFSVCEKRDTAVFGIVLFTFCFGFEVVSLWYLTPWFHTAHHVFAMLFIGFVVAVILKYLLGGGRITSGSIAGALCVYLLIAVFWALLYSLLEVIVPGSFVFNNPGASDPPAMVYGARVSVIPLYFSLVTLTTLGYGDIVPVSPVAGMLAVVQALVGQFYLTVMVAWLVGRYISDSMLAASDD